MDFIKVKDYNGEAVRYLQPKFNGHAMRVIRHDVDTIACHTRTPGINLWDKISQTYIGEQLLELPVGTELFGELHAPRVHPTDVKTLLNAADSRLLFNVFAMPLCAGEDWTDKSIPHVMAKVERLGLQSTQTVHLAELKPVKVSDVLATLLQGMEGVVAKEAHCHGWYRIKPFRTVDAVVVGSTMSFATTTAGALKAIQVAVFDGTKMVRIASVGSGFDMDYRFVVDRKTLNGKVAEIQYDGLTKDRKLQFPRFLRWRDDKLPSDCTMNQLKETI